MLHCTLVVLSLLYLLGAPAATAFGQESVDAKWIWFDEGNPAENAPTGKMWFRREVKAHGPATAVAIVACDDEFTLWVNGQKIGSGGEYKSQRFSLNGIVERGTNVFAVEATNKSGRAGLLIDAEIRGQGGESWAISCDSGLGWFSTKVAPQGDGWLKPGFDHQGWKRAKLLGSHADSPWKDLEFATGDLDRFQVAPGFALERIADHDLVGSLIAFTWGNRGRLLASRERGPILNVIDSDGDGRYDRVTEYCDDVVNCQGLCQVFDDLYAVGYGPQGTGLYRLPDRNHDDQADEVILVVNQQGSINEHGPHDVVFGPDGWLYHNLGNHSWMFDQPERARRERPTAIEGKQSTFIQGPEPESPCRNWEEGYLLQPAFEDALGHAVEITAPGGTIWRFTPDGKKWWVETVGFRNQYDIAFNRHGDLFTFDSDMEWDVNLPWYRPVRINHCIPGAEFGWRSGAKNWPAWYFDSLPATVDIGRGSPTGIMFYEHIQFPEKYHGAMINCDWSMGRIIVAFLKRDGASYTATTENLVTGNPLNVSDIEVDRDGSLVFCTGGRNTEGGIYRINHVAGRMTTPKSPPTATLDDVLSLSQPQATWNREAAAALKAKLGEDWPPNLAAKVRWGTPDEKIRALTLLSQHGPKPDAHLLRTAASDANAGVRQFAALLLGDHPSLETLSKLLGDKDAVVQRRACEAFIRSGLEPPVVPLLKLLGADDRWLRFSARVALERVPVDKWKSTVLEHADGKVQLEGLLALYRVGPGALSAREALAVLTPLFKKTWAGSEDLDLRRMLELVLIRVGAGGTEFADIRAALGETLLREFSRQTAGNFNRATASPLARESAELIAWLNVPGAASALLQAIESSRGDNATQTHYALCLRYVRDGWSDDIKKGLLDWYETTSDWEGGNSLAGYLENIVSGCLERYAPEDLPKIILGWRERPHAARLALATSQPDQIPDFSKLIGNLLADFEKQPAASGRNTLALMTEALGRSREPESQAMLRKLFEENPDQRDLLARALAKARLPENAPALVRAIASSDEMTTLQACLMSLARTDYRSSKADEYRAVVLAGLKMRLHRINQALPVLERWTGRSPPPDMSMPARIDYYRQWFAENFPDEPAPEPPQAVADKSGYTVPQLVEFLDTAEGAAGDVARGKQMFVKANCVKCHKFEKDGEGVGPDLTSLRRRFQRKEIVESILLPSQVISDQFAAVTIETVEGLSHTGMPLANPNPNVVILLLPDGTRLQIQKDKIDEQTRAKVSVMPEGLFKGLSLSDIADLFAFLETSKNNSDPTAANTSAAPAGGR